MREVRIRVNDQLGMVHVMSRHEDQMQLDTFRSAADSRWSIETAVTWALESMELQDPEEDENDLYLLHPHKAK